MADTRRFYFDDGSSRKRWHVQVQGKSQLVEYGRLGGALRESKKAFKSPAEAREQTDKLIAKKQREGYIEIDSARLEIVPLKGKRKPTAKQIAAFEKQIGSQLPEEYREFLKTCNGGRPNPDCVPVPGVEGIDNVGVGTLYHLQPSKPGVDELLHEWESSRDLLPPAHLPIAGSSDVFTLSLLPKTFGCVYWWFHETEEVDEEGNYLESAGYLLAGSFDEFLTRIALLFGDEEDVAAAESPSDAAKRPKATLRKLKQLVQRDLTPQTVKEIEQVVKGLGDLSGVENGNWPFTNITSPRVVRCLLEAGLNPEITDTENQSLLWQCASCPECVDLLLARGVDIDRRSGQYAETALMRAIFLEDLPAVKHLLQAGADPTKRPPSHINRPLAYNNELKSILEAAREMWKKSGASKSTKKKAAATSQAAVPAKKPKGPKPTMPRLLRLMKHDHFPEEFDELEEIEELIAALGDLSGIQEGQWPKIYKFESPRLLSALLQAGLNPEIVDKGGNTLLCQCVTHPECIDLLIDAGVDVDRWSGKKGDETALMRAAAMAEPDCVERLLAAGADPTLEFNSFAKVMLGMDEEKSELIESARAKWKRKPSRKPKRKRPARKK